MDRSICAEISEPISCDGSDSLLLRQPTPEADALELVDCFTIEATGQPLLLYKTAALTAGDWIQFDDLELSVDENLSQDEVAQCIFAICGGDLHTDNAVGETARHWVYYSTDMRGLLGFVLKPDAAS